MPRVVNKLIDRLSRLGYYVTLQPVEPEPAIVTQPPVEMPPVAEQCAETTSPESSRKRKPGPPCKCTERGIPCHHQLKKQEPEISYTTENTSG
jgi:hypothetical protein